MRQLGPYQLLRAIGRGGMAEVWSAKRPAGIDGAEKFVAIKLLAPHLAEQAAYRDMFLAEARLSMMLNHSNIVHVFDAVEDPPDCYMVMELVEGMTLSQLERGLGKQGLKIPLDVSAYVIGELLRALAYAHGLELDAGSIIVHRDVSPQNVMVTTSGEIKLMDFGIARFASEETQGTFVKGKLQYMPPEQLRKQTRKPTIDLFAVGGILHELIEGKRFRADVDEARLLGMVLQGEVPLLQTDVPLELDELRLGLLEADEERRIQSAKEAVQLLQGWPGYHHAGLELEALVQSFVASGSALRCPTDDVEPEDSSNDDGKPSSSESVMRQADPRAAAETMQAGAEQTDTSFELSTVARYPQIGPRRWSWAIAALLLIGGIGGTLLGLATATDDRHAVAPEPDAPAESEPAPQPAAPPLESELSVEDPSIPDEAPRVLVSVEFVAKEFAFVDIKVNGRVLELAPESRVRLPIGSFNVYLRTDKDAEWIKAGRITLEPAHQYRVEMRRPSALTMVDLGK